MSKNWKAILTSAALATSLFLSACVTPSDNGLVAGGVIGGVAGNVITGGSTVGTIAGAVGGAMIGRDQARRHYYYY